MPNQWMKRDPAKTGIYSFENASRTLAADEERKFMLDKNAWDSFRSKRPHIGEWRFGGSSVQRRKKRGQGGCRC
jgi:hypothetical protein